MFEGCAGRTGTGRRLDATLETARRWYNDCLAQRRAAYELVGWTVSHTYQLSQVKAHKASNPFAAGVHSHVLQLVCTDLDRAFQAFFRRLKAGQKPTWASWPHAVHLNSVA